MPSVGPNYPATLNNIGLSGYSWTNITNAGASDGNFATWVYSDNVQSDYFQAIDFGFAIATDATINGFVVEIRWVQSSDAVIQAEGLYLENDGGTSVGDDKLPSPSPSNIPTTIATQSFGGSSDTWNTGYTPSDVNQSDFGLSFTVRKTSGATVQTVSVDFVRITVHYTAAGGGAFIQTRTMTGFGS